LLSELLRLLAEISPQIIWILIFIAAIVAVFVLYIGIALWVTLISKDSRRQKVSYQAFRDLLDLFVRGKCR
jgi:Flp pilus assembly protein TadB